MPLNAGQAIQLMGQMIQARELIRRVHPSDWRLRVTATASVIRRRMEREQVGFMEAGAQMIKLMLDETNPNPGTIALVMAACMEDCDPTPEGGR
jgi:hypothetical protein